MSTDHTTDASLRPLEGTIGSDPVETFGVLANEKRMAILLALWDGHDPLGDDEGLTFTELRERVGLVQGGEFNYHLSRLVDRLVDRTDGGYVLRPIARRILELVIAGTPTSTVLDPVPIDVP
ncbi:MAG: winged helix-turn-helix domain-containing protein, partial [Halobacteriota archaeon]